jgi:hypothetical protein
MTSSLDRKRFASRVVSCLAVVLAAAVLFSLCACSEQESTVTEPAAVTQESTWTEPIAVEQESTVIEPVVVERELGPEALRTANAANALTLKYYIYARLKTEEFVAADLQAMPEGTFESLMDELLMVWETADALASEANALTGSLPYAAATSRFHRERHRPTDLGGEPVEAV